MLSSNVSYSQKKILKKSIKLLKTQNIEDITQYGTIYQKWINKDLSTINFDSLSDKEKMAVNRNISIAMMMEVNKYRKNKLKVDNRLIQSAKKW